ncbi:thaumatin-like protein [Quercus suber]|uniref:Thaumatin-like protein n=1 Tax=Quercus suber TaxID=58331 RepID=A0AAW0KKZ1_QUESU
MMCRVGLQVRSHDNRRVVACESACFAFNLPRLVNPQHTLGFSRRLVLRLTLMLMMILLAFLLALVATIWSHSALTPVE